MRSAAYAFFYKHKAFSSNNIKIFVIEYKVYLHPNLIMKKRVVPCLGMFYLQANFKIKCLDWTIQFMEFPKKKYI